MDSFEFNKFAGAVLGSVLFILAVSILAETLYETEEANPRAYAVAALEEGGEGGGEAAEAPKEVPLATLLAQADIGACTGPARLAIGRWRRLPSLAC